MQLRLSPGTRGTRTGALYRQLLDAIRTGRLVAGERLPTSRELAADLRIARGTVVAALDRLVAEGLVVARPGSGLYVAEQVVPTRRPRAPRGVLAGPRPVWSALPPPADTPPALPFDLSITDQSLSDRAVVQRAAAAGVGVEPLSPRYLGPPRQGLVLGFRHITTERLPEAVERLEQVLARIAHSPRSE